MTGKTARSSKVVWTPAEWQSIAQRMALLLSQSPMAKLKALELAQEELGFAQQRRRIPATWSVVAPKLEALLDAEREKLRQRAAEIEERAKEPVYPPEVLRAIEVAGKLDSWLALTGELFGPALAKMLSSSGVLDDVRRAAGAQPVAKPAAPDVFSTSFSATAEALRRPKVLVAGLLPAQAGEVVREFEGVEFRFWHTDESKDKLRTLAKNCHVAVGMTNFLSHPADASLQSLAPQYVRHAGGISRLKEVIRQTVSPVAPGHVSH